MRTPEERIAARKQLEKESQRLARADAKLVLSTPEGRRFVHRLLCRDLRRDSALPLSGDHLVQYAALRNVALQISDRLSQWEPSLWESLEGEARKRNRKDIEQIIIDEEEDND